MRQINDAGLELIKKFEGCELVSYYDMIKVLTIGFGHTGPDVTEGRTLSQSEAEQLLYKDLQRFEDAVESLVTVSLTDNQFAALVSFSFNLGVTPLKHSTLLKLLNEGKYDEAADQFQRWDKAGAREVPGLLRRRLAEAELFRT